MAPRLADGASSHRGRVRSRASTDRRDGQRVGDRLAGDQQWFAPRRPGGGRRAPPVVRGVRPAVRGGAVSGIVVGRPNRYHAGSAGSLRTERSDSAQPRPPGPRPAGTEGCRADRSQGPPSLQEPRRGGAEDPFGADVGHRAAERQGDGRRHRVRAAPRVHRRRRVPQGRLGGLGAASGDRSSGRTVRRGIRTCWF